MSSKQYSGLAASDKEYVRTLARIIGNPNEQEDVKAQKLRNFANQLKEKFNQETQYMLKHKRYSVVREAMSQVKPKTPKTTKETKPTTDKDSTEFSDVKKSMEDW